MRGSERSRESKMQSHTDTNTQHTVRINAGIVHVQCHESTLKLKNQERAVTYMYMYILTPCDILF